MERLQVQNNDIYWEWSTLRCDARGIMQRNEHARANIDKCTNSPVHIMQIRLNHLWKCYLPPTPRCDPWYCWWCFRCSWFSESYNAIRVERIFYNCWMLLQKTNTWYKKKGFQSSTGCLLGFFNISLSFHYFTEAFLLLVFIKSPNIKILPTATQR